MVWRLIPHVPMRVPVVAYVVVITAMVAAAVSAWRAGGSGWIVVGALLFYLSALAVARQRFVVRSFWDRAWGLPLYYAGQTLLALSVAGMTGLI